MREAEHLKWRLFHRLAQKMLAKSDLDASRSQGEIAERLRMPVTMKSNRGGKGGQAFNDNSHEKFGKYPDRVLKGCRKWKRFTLGIERMMQRYLDARYPADMLFPPLCQPDFTQFARYHVPLCYPQIIK